MNSSLEEVLNRAQNAIQRAKSLTQRWSEGPSVLLGGHLGPQNHNQEPCHPQNSDGGPSFSPSSEHRPSLPSPLPSFSTNLSSPTDHFVQDLHPPQPQPQSSSGSSNNISSGSSSSSLTVPSSAPAASQAPARMPNWIDRMRARRSGMVNAAPVPIHCPSPPSCPLRRSRSGEVADTAPDVGEQFMCHRSWQDAEGVSSRGTSCLTRDGLSAPGTSHPQRHEGGPGHDEGPGCAEGGSDPETFRGRFEEGRGRVQEEERQGDVGAGRHAGGGDESGNEGRGYEDGRAWRPTVAQPFLQVARNLASLQQQQSNTLNQLLSLRLKQLRLRQQQLASLQELLQAEYEAVQGTPLQVSAVQQALQLLSQSLEDMDLAATAITASRALDDVGSVAQTVARADARAEDTARMARQLLGVLREFPRRMEDLLQNVMEAPAPSRGASELEVAQVPLVTCSSTHPLVGESCPICLSDFRPMDDLKCLGCCHFYHASCMDQWLHIKANCPLCMHPLRHEEASAQQEDREDGQQEGFLLGESTFEVPLFPGPVTFVSMREREPPSLARALRSAAALRLSLSGLGSSIAAAAAADGGSRGHVQGGSTAAEAVGGTGFVRDTSAAGNVAGNSVSNVAGNVAGNVTGTGLGTGRPAAETVAYPTQHSQGPSNAAQHSSSSSSNSSSSSSSSSSSAPSFVFGSADTTAADIQQQVPPEAALLAGAATVDADPELTLGQPTTSNNALLGRQYTPSEQPTTSNNHRLGGQRAPLSAAHQSCERRLSGTGDDDVLSFSPKHVAPASLAQTSLYQPGLQRGCPAGNPRSNRVGASQGSDGDMVLRLAGDDEQPAHRSAAAAVGDAAPGSGPMVHGDGGLAQAMQHARAWLGLHYPEC